MDTNRSRVIHVHLQRTGISHPVNAASLRAQFEPIGLYDGGFAEDAAQCAAFWSDRNHSHGGQQLIRQFESATAWLALCEQTKSINTRSSSYGLKHEAERWCRDQGHERSGYISNGALLMAAIWLGFKVQRCSDRSPNGWLNIGKKRPQGRDAV